MALSLTNDQALRDQRPPQFHRYLVLTTFRRDGRAVPTVVWFAAQGDKLYVRTPATAGKLKRIRHDGHVLLTPSNRTGDARGYTVAGQARMLPQLEARTAAQALDRKYGWRAEMLHVTDDVRYNDAVTYLEITPDPGPGTADLLLETLSDEQRRRELLRAATIGAAIGGLAGGLFFAMLRLSRGRARGPASR